MPAHLVSISVDGTTHNIVPSLVQGYTLLNLVPLLPSDQLLFEVDGDVDVPITPIDVIVLKGGEVFSIGDGCPRISDNPTVRKSLRLSVNDQVFELRHHPRHAKLTGAEIKALAVIPVGAELWLDLKGLADERIDDNQLLILRDGYTFFTKAPDADQGCNGSSHELNPVQVKVDDVDRSILPGVYSVQNLKQRFSIPMDYALEQVVDGKFYSLSESEAVTINGGEVFISHVPRGGSS